MLTSSYLSPYCQYLTFSPHFDNSTNKHMTRVSENADENTAERNIVQKVTERKKAKLVYAECQTGKTSAGWYHGTN